MKTSHAPPFDLNNSDALKCWLADLKKLNGSQACSELYQILHSLRQSPPEALIKLAILEQLREPVQHYADQIETLVLTESLKSKTLVTKTANLSSQLLSNLSLNYCQISKSTDLDPHQQLIVLYLALHLIGLALRKQAVFKQCPTSRLWKKSADLYQLALNHDLLTQEIPDRASLRIHPKNIISVLQRNLLFSLFNPYHFQSSDVSHLFEFAERYFDLLHINNPEQFADFVWIPNQNTAPQPYHFTHATHQNLLYLNTEAVVAHLSAHQIGHLTETELDLLQHRLTGYREISHSILPTVSKAYQLVFEATQIHAQLSRFAAVANIHRMSSEAPHSSKPQRLLQLEPLHAATPAHKQTTTDTSQTQPSALTVSVYNTRYDNFVAAVIPLLDLQIDQPVLLIKAPDHLQLGIVKHIFLNTVNHSQRILIALLPGQIENIHLSTGTQHVQAILIKQDSGNFEVLVPPAHYQNNTKIISTCRTLPGEYCLGSLQETTAFFLRYQLSQVHEQA